MSASINNGSCKINISNGLLLYYHQYSYYSQKVLMALYEKKLPFESHIINLASNSQYEPWFLELNPRGEVPVLQDGGKIIADSIRIIDYLEDNFYNGDIPKLIPMDEGHKIRQKVTYFRIIIDQIQSGLITLGSFYHSELVTKPKAPFIEPVRKALMNAEENRSEFIKKHAAENPKVENVLIKKLEVRDKRHTIITDKNEFLNSLEQIDNVLDKVEEELSTHTEDKQTWWLCSNTFTAADISLAILLERLNQLGFEHRFWKDLKRPHIEKYYERVRCRESFKKTIPNNFYHIKMFVTTNKQLVIGIATVTLTFFIGSYYLIKNLIQ